MTSEEALLLLQELLLLLLLLLLRKRVQCWRKVALLLVHLLLKVVCGA